MSSRLLVMGVPPGRSVSLDTGSGHWIRILDLDTGHWTWTLDAGYWTWTLVDTGLY